MMFRLMDSDSSGGVSFAEVVTGLSLLTRGNSSERLRLLFEVHDEDHSGFIEPPEMVKLVQALMAVHLDRESLEHVLSMRQQAASFCNSLTQRVASHMMQGAVRRGALDAAQTYAARVVQVFWRRRRARSDLRDDVQVARTQGPREAAEAYVARVFGHLDADGDGKISWDEFQVAVDRDMLLREALHHGGLLDDGDEELGAGPASSLITAPEWVPKDSRAHCAVCSAAFQQPTRRRHHCRHCGEVVCDSCSPDRLPVPQFDHDAPVRVCTPCVEFLHGQAAAAEGGKEGYLFKRGPNRSTWRRRWFTLQDGYVTGERVMHYCVDHSKNEPRGTIYLRGAKVELPDEDSGTVFHIVTPGRVYVLRASSHAVLEAWVRAIDPHYHHAVPLMRRKSSLRGPAMARKTSFRRMSGGSVGGVTGGGGSGAGGS